MNRRVFLQTGLGIAATSAWGMSSSELGRTGALQEAIMDSFRRGKRRFSIPAGTYLISPPSEGSHVNLRNLSDFEIDGTDVTLVLKDQTRGGIEFQNCRNVRFSGATIHYETPPFTQGVIERIARNGTWYEVRIEKGYPTDMDDPEFFPSRPTGYLFDPKTRWWKPGTYDLYGNKIERLGANLFRLYWNRPSGPALHPVALGDLMGFRGRGRHNVTFINCARMQIAGVSVLSAGSFAFWESGGEGGSHYTITVKRGPRPAGAVTDPLFSSTADAFHSAAVRHGPTVEHSYLESMPDDGIAIHGFYSHVFETRGDKLVINKSSFQPGDPLHLFDTQDRLTGEAVIKSVRPMGEYHNNRRTHRRTIADFTRGPYFEITLDRKLPAHFDYVASNPSALGSSYTLRYNRIRRHRARGMLLKAENGLVERNTIDGSSMGGIVLTPEFWWNEACFSRRVIIRDNVVRKVAYYPRQMGAIVVAALEIEEDKPIATYGHQHITLENNTIEGVNGVNLFISSAEEVSVRENRFLDAQRVAAWSAGNHWGMKADTLIFVAESRKVRFEGNSASGLGNYNAQLIKATPTAQVEGALTGVKKVHRP